MNLIGNLRHIKRDLSEIGSGQSICSEDINIWKLGQDRKGLIFISGIIGGKVMDYVIGALSSLIVAILSFIIQQLLRDNKRLRAERKDKNMEKEQGLADGCSCPLSRSAGHV